MNRLGDHIAALETERLLLRPPNTDDVGAMLGFLTSERARFYGGPLATVSAWMKFAAYVGQWTLRGYGMYAIVLRETAETAGMAGPYHPEGFDEPEMSWLLTDARFEGRGIAREACQAVLRDLFASHGWRDVVSFIDRANSASLNLAERLGARSDPNTPSPLTGCVTYRHRAPS